MHDVFSVAQIFGYFAFVFGVACFLQKNDMRFRVLLCLESLSYVVHFWLLGNYPAMASASMALTRTFTAIYTRSRWAAAFFVTLTIALGIWLIKDWVGVMPILASCIGTTAVFLFSGITMRLLMLTATFLWLANNILSGSIGGTLLEACIALSNGYTIWQLRRDQLRCEQVH
ncbi:MAG: YgjV family protein [Rhodocyclaceae bacterium]